MRVGSLHPSQNRARWGPRPPPQPKPGALGTPGRTLSKTNMEGEFFGSLLMGRRRRKIERSIARTRSAKTGIARRGLRIEFRKSERGMDMTWITERIALGGGIWNARNMGELAQAGVTHILNMQIEFDDRPLAEPYGIQVLWNPTDDNFLPKPPELLKRGVDFALEALEDPRARLYVHCAAGVHRAPMMTLAVLCAMDWKVDSAMHLIESKRPVVDFADVYVESVRHFLGTRLEEAQQSSERDA